MTTRPEHSVKVLLVLLTLGVWGVLLRSLFLHEPAHAQGQGAPQVGRYMIVSESSALVILDTATGTYKRTDQTQTYTSTWDKDYLHGTVTPVVGKK